MRTEALDFGSTSSGESPREPSANVAVHRLQSTFSVDLPGPDGSGRQWNLGLRSFMGASPHGGNGAGEVEVPHCGNRVVNDRYGAASQRKHSVQTDKSGEFRRRRVIFHRSRRAGELVAIMDRYVAVQEPTCTWAVFDSFDDVPAEVGGVVLVGLEEAAAMELASSANEERALRLRQIFALGRLRLVVGQAV